MENFIGGLIFLWFNLILGYFCISILYLFKINNTNEKEMLNFVFKKKGLKK